MVIFQFIEHSTLSQLYHGGTIRGRSKKKIKEANLLLYFFWLRHLHAVARATVLPASLIYKLHVTEVKKF